MKKIKIDDYIEEISMGPFGSDITVDNYIESGIPVLNGSNLTQHKLQEKKFNYISEDKADKLRKANAKRGDIVFTHRGTLGQASYIPDNSRFQRYVISQSQFRVKFNDDIDPIYFTYLIKSEYGQKKLLSFKNHVGVPALAQATTNFRNLTLDIEDIEDQRIIAKILRSIDEKIEINISINEELESQTRLIYDFWFTQYDFPDKNSNPYRTSGGQMVFSTKLKQDIPEGWDVISLKDLIDVSKNGDWGSDSVDDEKIMVYCVRGADINGLNGLSDFDPPVRYIEHSHSNRLLKKNDLIIEISGGSPTQSTGRMAHISQDVLDRLNGKAVCSNFCKAVSLKNDKLSYIVNQYWNKLYEAEVFFNFEGKTSGIKNLLFDQLIKDVFIAVPNTQELIDTYYKLANKLDSQKQALLVQNKELSELRDWLLPMLLTGQVKRKEIKQ